MIRCSPSVPRTIARWIRSAASCSHSVMSSICGNAWSLSDDALGEPALGDREELRVEPRLLGAVRGAEVGVEDALGDPERDLLEAPQLEVVEVRLDRLADDRVEHGDDGHLVGREHLRGVRGERGGQAGGRQVVAVAQRGAGT